MERFSERESVLLGYNVQRSLMMSSGSSTSKPFGDSDVDFHDVFGGPPRRFSMQELRRSGEEGGATSAWPGLEEKPVFGDDLLSSRRRNTSDDFFDDIFGGGASVSSSPVRTGRDGHALLASPGARLLSPLPPKVEPLGSSSLLPKFSLPAKSKGAEIPTFGSSSRRNSYTSPSGIPHSYSSGNSLTRFSSEAVRGSEAPKPDSSHQLSSLFKETPFVGHDKSTKLTKLSEKVEANNGGDAKCSEKSANSSSHFHFSIYKWASKGVPLDLPLRGKSSSKSKFMAKPERRDSEENGSSKPCETPSFESSSDGHALPNVASSKIECNEKIKPQAQTQTQTQIQSDNRDDPEEKSSESEEARKDEARTIRAFLSDHDVDNDIDETARGSSTPVVARTKAAKKQDRENASSDIRERNRRSKALGRVTEFVKIFNQETAPKPKDGPMLRTRSCKWNEKLVFVDETSVKSTGENEKPQAPKANDDPKQSAKVYASVHDSPSPNCESYSDGSKVTVEETEESFNDQLFQVKELIQDENDNLGSVTNNQEFKEIDVKIRQWTKGKEGNIRSLLSTLQYVLWTESGWKAVPLMDIIEGNAVKRAYQKALLCLHPDKLQQKGAASHQKYMAEKVFDILQDAWNYYISLGAV